MPAATQPSPRIKRARTPSSAAALPMRKAARFSEQHSAHAAAAEADSMHGSAALCFTAQRAVDETLNGSLTSLGWLSSLASTASGLCTSMFAPASAAAGAAAASPARASTSSSSSNSRRAAGTDNGAAAAADICGPAFHEEEDDAFESIDWPNETSIKPPFSYATLIYQAIKESHKDKIPLCDIYEYIQSHYGFYKPHETAWKNSVRHNLSQSKCFVKVSRGSDEPGKGGYWKIDPSYERVLEASADKRRRKFKKKMRIIKETKFGGQGRAARPAGSTATACTAAMSSAAAAPSTPGTLDEPMSDEPDCLSLSLAAQLMGLSHDSVPGGDSDADAHILAMPSSPLASSPMPESTEIFPFSVTEENISDICPPLVPASASASPSSQLAAARGNSLLGSSLGLGLGLSPNASFSGAFLPGAASLASVPLGASLNGSFSSFHVGLGLPNLSHSFSASSFGLFRSARPSLDQDSLLASFGGSASPFRRSPLGNVIEHSHDDDELDLSDMKTPSDWQ